MVLNTPHLEHDLQQLRAELHDVKLVRVAAKTWEASGVTPKGYDRSLLDDNSDRRSALEDRYDSLDKFFFVLYVLRTGPNNLAIAGISFGWDAAFVKRWFPAWLRVLKLVLVMHFPRLTEEIIRITTPPNIAAKFPDYGGSFDATEMRMEVSSNPMWLGPSTNIAIRLNF